MHSNRFTRAITFGVFLSLSSLTLAVQEYEVVNIGNLSGAAWGRAVAINNSNTIVGWSKVDGKFAGYRWTEAWGMEDMNKWGKDEYVFTDINDSGNMVGYFKENGISTGFIHWSPGPGVHAIWYNEPVGNHTDTQTFGINNLNNMVGNMGTEFSETRAAGWTIQFDGFLYPGYGQQEASRLYAINDSNIAVGYSMVNGTQRATRYFNDGTMQDLHSMLPTASHSLAGNINDQGCVTGSFRGQDSKIWSYYFNPEVGMQVFENMPGLETLSFSGLSDNGVVVGYGNPDQPGFDNQAMRWTNEAGLIDLNSLIDQNSGWELDEAYDVNESGYIVGSGKLNGRYSNFMLKPVPEPATVVGLGLGAFALLRRRIRRS
jgi:hypothetical protein